MLGDEGLESTLAHFSALSAGAPLASSSWTQAASTNLAHCAVCTCVCVCARVIQEETRSRRLEGARRETLTFYKESAKGSGSKGASHLSWCVGVNHQA
jgi:hypothetical protein